MKVWVLKRLVPDEHHEIHYYFVNVFKSFEAVKEFINSFEQEENPHWQDCHYAMLKNCAFANMRGYWEATETEVKG